MPIVSVIIPVFNREKFITNTLNSLKKQNHRPLEVIIVDDASTDNTVSRINTFIKNNFDKKFNLFLHVNRTNRGACFCRNYGILNSNGKYIQFLDSDDFLHANKIKDQVQSLESNNSKLAISDYQYFKNNVVIKSCKNDGNLLKKISLGWSVYTSSPLINSNLIKGKLNWNEKITFLQDKDFLFKVLMLSGEYTHVPGFTSYYVQHNDNQISDLYTIKKPQFFTIIYSRLFFLFSNLFKMKFQCIFYTCVGIFETVFEFILYYIKKGIKTFFGKKIFNQIKNILRNNN